MRVMRKMTMLSPRRLTVVDALALLGTALIVAAMMLFAPTLANEPLPSEGDEPLITIGVSPPRLELELDAAGVADSVKVFNFGSETAHINVSVHDWSLDEQNQVELLAPTEQSLNQWMLINPVTFSIPAGGSQTVRFAVRPRVEPEPGEHRAILYFTQAPRIDVDEQMRVVGRLGVAVYAYAGEIARDGELHGVRVDGAQSPIAAAFDVSSLGNGHVRLDGHYAVWPAGTYPGVAAEIDPTLGKNGLPALPEGAVEIGALPGLPVLPGSRRNLLLALQRRLEPGAYVLDVQGALAGEPVEMAIPFSVGASRIARDASE